MTRRQSPATNDMSDSGSTPVFRPPVRSHVTMNMSDLPTAPPVPMVEGQTQPLVPVASGVTRIRTLRVAGGRDMLNFVTLFPDEEVIIGREETATLVLSDASVSRRHVKVNCGVDGLVTIRDLHSLNGTTITDDLSVKGDLIEASPLPAGSWLEVGGVALHLEMLSLDQVCHLERMVARLEERGREPGTGLLPVSWLDDDLPALMQRQADSEQHLSCILAELDQTDAIRTRFGETVMREMLSSIPRLLMWRVRQTDFCVQHGPKVSMIVLPGADLSVGAAVAERLRREVSSYRWPRPIAGSRITISTGLSAWDGRESIPGWIGRAQAMLDDRRRQRRV